MVLGALAGLLELKEGAWIFVRDSMLRGNPECEMVQGFAQWYMQSTLNVDMFLNQIPAILACEDAQTSCTDQALYSG